MAESRFNNVSQTVADLKRDPDYTDFWTPTYRTNPPFNVGIPAGDETGINISYDDLGTHGHAAILSPVRARSGTCNSRQLESGQLCDRDQLRNAYPADLECPLRLLPQ